MGRSTRFAAAAIGVVALLALAASGFATAHGTAKRTAETAAIGGCTLGGAGQAAHIQHVIYLQFDNVHYRGDARPRGRAGRSPADAEPAQLPDPAGHPVRRERPHDPDLAHRGRDRSPSLTGLYPDRGGCRRSPTAFGYYPASKVPAFSSSFKYWTALDGSDQRPAAEHDHRRAEEHACPLGAVHPAGRLVEQHVGGVGTANIELENANTAATGDITKVFGNPSPEFSEVAANPQLGQTDFVGIAIHCGRAPRASCCNGNANAHPDPLPDEPGELHRRPTRCTARSTSTRRSRAATPA